MANGAIPVIPNLNGVWGETPTAPGILDPSTQYDSGDYTSQLPVALPFFTEVLTRNPNNPILTGAMVDPSFNLAADPGLLVVNGKLWVAFETGANDVAGNVHLNRIFMGSTSSPNGPMDPTYYKISHDDTKNCVAPKKFIHNGLVHAIYTEGAVSPPGAPAQGILWERHMPLSQFPTGAWSTAAVTFDPTLVASWNGSTTKRCLDNQAIVQWGGRWFLLCGDSNDAKIYARWSPHFTMDWVNDAQDVAGGAAILDVANSSWLKTMTEMRAVTIGSQLFLVFGGKRKSDNLRGIVVFSVSSLNVDGPLSLDGTWLRKDLAFAPAASGWDSVDVHCADVVPFKDTYVMAYDARPALSGATSSDWKIGFASVPFIGTASSPAIGAGERMRTPGGSDSIPLSVPNWRLGGSSYHRRYSSQLLDFISSFQSLQADSATTAIAGLGSLTGTLKWYGGVLGPDGVSIYGVPLNSTSVLKINTTADTTSLIDISGLSGGTNTNKYIGGVLAPNGVIYCAPYSNQNILRIDTMNADAVTVIDVSGLTGGTGTFKWFGGVLAPNGIIYFIPQDAQSILRLDPSTDTPTIIDISTLTGATATDKWNGGVLAANGAIYCIPKNAANILRFDTATETAAVFGAPGAGVDKYIGGVLGANGKIYGIPYSAGNVLEIDPTTDTISTFGTIAGVTQYFGGVLAANGFIYAIPRDATTVLKINTSAKTVSTFGSLAGTGKWMGGVLSSNGSIYGIPRNSTTIVKMLSALTLPVDLPLNRMLNKF